MVGPLKFQRRQASAVLFAALAAGPAGLAPARAAELPDPTRPPLVARRTLAGTPSTPQPVAAPIPVLQSVLRGEGRKPTAIISGRVVELGETFDALRLVQLTETGAVLRAERGATTTLVLTPAAGKLTADADRRLATVVAVPVRSPPLPSPVFQPALPPVAGGFADFDSTPVIRVVERP